MPDNRRGKNASYAMADFALAVFGPWFLQSPSFLAHQRHLETNCLDLFGMSKIPGDGQVRAMLDPVDPLHFHPMFMPEACGRRGRRRARHELLAGGQSDHSDCRATEAPAFSSAVVPGYAFIQVRRQISGPSCAAETQAIIVAVTSPNSPC